MTGDVNLTHIRDALDRRAWHVGLVCERCGDRLSYDQDSGYWMHRERRDGRNGLYCSSESWTWEDGRELAVPTDPALAQLAAAEAVIQAVDDFIRDGSNPRRPSYARMVDARDAALAALGDGQ